MCWKQGFFLDPLEEYLCFSRIFLMVSCETHNPKVFSTWRTNSLVWLDCELSQTVSIIFLSTRCVTFFGLPLDPFQSSHPSFSTRDMIFFTVLIFKETDFSDFLRRFAFVITEIDQLYNSFLKLVFLVFMSWNIRIAIALREVAVV